MKLAALSLSLLLTVLPTRAEEIERTENTKGCVMSFCTTEGTPMFRFFVKVADDEYNDRDTDEPQIWGYDPVNTTMDKKGKIVLERVLAKLFIKAGRFGHIEHQPCRFRCPLW